MIYKIKVYTYKLKATISDDITKLTDYFKKHGITLDLSIEETAVPKQDVPLKLFTPNDGKCDVVMYVYDKASFNMQSQGLAFNHSQTLRAIYLATTTWDDAVDYTWKSMAHEIMHTLFYKFNIPQLDPMDIMKVGNTWKPYYKNEELDSPDGNFAEAFKRLAPYITMKYKYFKDSEVKGLKPEFVKLLDEARGIAGVPFIITSGYRTPEKNASVGGVEDSSHTTGLAVDIRVKDGVTGGKILLALVKVGLTRFGFYKDGHIHVDYDNTKPNPCYWIK